jgi:hypothetical protein
MGAGHIIPHPPLVETLAGYIEQSLGKYQEWPPKQNEAHNLPVKYILYYAMNNNSLHLQTHTSGSCDRQYSIEDSDQ